MEEKENVHSIRTEAISKSSISIYTLLILVVGSFILNFLVLISLMLNDYIFLIMFMIAWICLIVLINMKSYFDSINFIKDKFIFKVVIYALNDNDDVWEDVIYASYMRSKIKFKDLVDELRIKHLIRILEETEQDQQIINDYKNKVNELVRKVRERTQTNSSYVYEFDCAPFYMFDDQEIPYKRMIIVSSVDFPEFKDYVLSKGGRYEYVKSTYCDLRLVGFIKLPELVYKKDNHEVIFEKETIPVFELISNKYIVKKAIVEQKMTDLELQSLIIKEYERRIASLLMQLYITSEQLKQLETLKVNIEDYGKKYAAQLLKYEEETGEFPTPIINKISKIAKTAAKATFTAGGLIIMVIIIYLLVTMFIII